MSVVSLLSPFRSHSSPSPQALLLLALVFLGLGEGRPERGPRRLRRVEEDRSGQHWQGTRDDADAPSLVLVLSASVLRVRNKYAGSSLLSSDGA